MKKLFAVFLLTGFAIAVCHAVPSSSQFERPSYELSVKKHFELQACELPAVFEVPAAPAVIHDLVVIEVNQSCKIVNPQANSPPEKEKNPISYSMAYWC